MNPTQNPFKLIGKIVKAFFSHKIVFHTNEILKILPKNFKLFISINGNYSQSKFEFKFYGARILKITRAYLLGNIFSYKYTFRMCYKQFI